MTGSHGNQEGAALSWLLRRPGCFLPLYGLFAAKQLLVSYLRTEQYLAQRTMAWAILKTAGGAAWREAWPDVHLIVRGRLPGFLPVGGCLHWCELGERGLQSSAWRANPRLEAPRRAADGRGAGGLRDHAAEAAGALPGWSTRRGTWDRERQGHFAKAEYSAQGDQPAFWS